MTGLLHLVKAQIEATQVELNLAYDHEEAFPSEDSIQSAALLSLELQRWQRIQAKLQAIQ